MPVPEEPVSESMLGSEDAPESVLGSGDAPLAVALEGTPPVGAGESDFDAGAAVDTAACPRKG